MKAAEHATRRGVNWFVWRVVTHPRIPDGLSDVRSWSIPELLDAHLVLDALAVIDAREK
tara:strand:+ start:7918 stop:8094 length:177 start_codon:yes stop_codon:yes gene_type:complete